MVSDIVIVGAGSAGSVIAARASEDPNRTVLLLEAGPDYPQLADTPFDLRNGNENSLADHDWRYRYQPATGARDVHFPRGRVTGGSSAVNTAIALRSIPEDHRNWPDEWAWDRVLPAYRRLERDLDFGADRGVHGDSGPITVRRYPPAEQGPVHQAFLATVAALGYPAAADQNAPDAQGYGPHPMNKLGRLRVSAAVGYLAPARVRPNLTILAQRHTRRLVFEGMRVTGVEVERPDGTIETHHGRLVVLCAGAIGSPTILLRSGVGPKAELERLGIDLVADLAGVGARLDDHPGLPVICTARHPEMVDTDMPLIQTVLRYTGEGSPHRLDCFVEPVTFIRMANRAPSFGVLLSLFHTQSRGRLRLASADPHAAPVIETGFGSDEYDNDRLARCLMDTVRIAQSGPLAELVAEIGWPRLPLDLEGARHLARTRAGSGYHPCATVPMGDPADPLTAVDPHGRVRGVDNLVVADASIMPAVPRANTNLTSLMIGEMVGEWLRASSVYGL